MANNKKQKNSQTDKTIELAPNTLPTNNISDEIIVEEQIIDENANEETHDVIIIEEQIIENVDSNELFCDDSILTPTVEENSLDVPEITVLDYINLNYAQQKQFRRTGRLK